MKDSIKLTWWNEKTYEDVKNFFKTSHACAIENATGTGKTSVISKVILDFIEKDENANILIIAPRDDILIQYRNERYGLKNYSSNITYISYQMLAMWYKNKDNKLFELNNLSLIVCDELHRAGAKTWSKAIFKLLSMNKDVYLLGASATPRRYDQKEQKEDMIDLLFDSNRAGKFDLLTSLNLGILPKPTYIVSLYSLKDEFDNIKEKANNLINDEEEKKNLLNEIKEIEIDWYTSHNYDKTLKTFLNGTWSSTSPNKILIFCKNINDIKEKRDNFDPIFHKIFAISDDFKIGEYHSRTSKKDFIEFRDNNTPGSVRILYSVDKFNEGLHIPNLRTIIMTRETMSEVIYFQQIGRVLSISSNEHPLIIDFVNNFNNVKNYDIWNEILKTEKDRPRSYNISGKERELLSPYFYSEIKDAEKIFDKVKSRINELVLYTYKGETNSLKYFCDKYHKDFKTIYAKVHNGGMSLKEAILTTDDIKEEIIVNYNGENISVYDLCKKLKKNKALVDYRLKNGMSIYDAIK